MGNVLHVDSNNWQAIEASSKPVLADFWAEWCGPCRALAPTFDKLAEAYGKDFVFVKVNVDEMSELAEKFRVQAIPTLMLLKNGEPVEILVGYHSYEDLEKVLARNTSPVLAE